jgi:hypothetical protein
MLFILIWMLCSLGLWTVVRTKLHWYILPIYPALSICIAYAFARIIKARYIFPVALMFLLTIAIHVKRNVFAANYSPDLKSISALVKNVVPSGKEVFLYNSNDRSANFFYSERPTTSLLTEQSLVETSRRSDFYCLISKKDFEGLKARSVNLPAAVRGSFGELLLLAKK